MHFDQQALFFFSAGFVRGRFVVWGRGLCCPLTGAGQAHRQYIGQPRAVFESENPTGLNTVKGITAQGLRSVFLTRAVVQILAR